MSEIKTPINAIRAFCLSCVGTPNEVKLCVSKNCPLYPFRLGKNPYIQKREYTEEQRQEMRARMLRMRSDSLEKPENQGIFSDPCNLSTDAPEDEFRSETRQGNQEGYDDQDREH